VPEPALPTGTVTYLFTDIEGSTSLWERYPQAMPAALVRHDTLIEQAVADHGGVVVRPRGEGDSRFAVFAQASAAVSAAAAIQLALCREHWALAEPLRVRLALHTGEADLRQGDYYGNAVNRCARLRALAHGRQILLSEATAALVGDQLSASISLRNLGSYPLRGSAQPETVFQLLHPELPQDFPVLQASIATRGRLPVQPTRLIARENELREIEQALMQPGVRLLTLVGTGGVGKTRLAVAAAGHLQAVFDQGCWFVDLAPLRDSSLVVPTIAHTLGLHEAGGRSSFQVLTEYARPQQLLLVLDNFEHLIDGGLVLGELLAACPELKILVTSREPLHLRWEHLLPVSPLAVPDRAGANHRTIQHTPAVELFVECARAVEHRFQLTDENASSVAEICRRLDGLPLALELAAARIRLLPPVALLERLGHLDLPGAGAADTPARHRTLRAAIDWSYNLLNSSEQRLLARVAVFVDGFSAEAAGAVVNAEGDSPADVLDGLAALLDSSLLRRVSTYLPNEARFGLLETVREYALEHLAATGDEIGIRNRHAAYFARWMDDVEHQLTSNEQTALLARLELEHDNLRAALRWQIRSGQTGQALQLGAALSQLLGVARRPH